MKTKSIIIFIFISINFSFGQGSYKVYTALLYHVIKNTQWPDGKLSENMIVGVIGSSEMANNLKAMATTKSVNGKKIVVKEFSNGNQITNDCNVIFLAKPKNSQLSNLKMKSSSNSILLITESSGGASKGAVVNLTIVSGKPVIELNESQAITNKLKITSELKKLAKLVK